MFSTLRRVLWSTRTQSIRRVFCTDEEALEAIAFKDKFIILEYSKQLDAKVAYTVSKAIERIPPQYRPFTNTKEIQLTISKLEQLAEQRKLHDALVKAWAKCEWKASHLMLLDQLRRERNLVAHQSNYDSNAYQRAVCRLHPERRKIFVEIIRIAD